MFPDIKGAYEKLRFSEAALESQHIFAQEAAEPLLVMENGVTYATYLNEGLMTGIFLDQKNVRGALAGGLSTGKTLLNMFSYTGAFSVTQPIASVLSGVLLSLSSLYGSVGMAIIMAGIVIIGVVPALYSIKMHETAIS